MAGTIVADTIQDGAGNSTAMDNAIYGSAKAWVNFGYVSSAITVRKQYNVSSVTRSGAGLYQINFTNALADANYVATGIASYANATGQTAFWVNGPAGTMTTSAFNIQTNDTYSVTADCQFVTMAFFD